MATSPQSSRRLAAIVLTSTLLSFLMPASANSAPAARAWDFDGDGRRDLAVGIPGENAGAGAVEVFESSAAGPDTSTRVRFSAEQLPGVPEDGDRFGAALASGDFDADGFADLAVSIPREDLGTDPATMDVDGGAVLVVYGRATGLHPAGAHFLKRANPELGQPDLTEATFGFDLEAADFDGDGDHDLAVAALTGQGGLLVYAGGTRGLAGAPAQQIGPGFGLPDTAGFYIDDMAVGDLDDNGVTDLAIGNMGADQARGVAIVLYGKPRAGGSAGGLSTRGTRVPGPQVWSQDTPGVAGVADELDGFGSAVAIGDVDGDGRKDLVVTASQEPLGGATASCSDGAACGAIHVLKGSRTGVTAAADLYAEYDDLWVDPVAYMGTEVAVGDLNQNGYADIAITSGNETQHRWGSVLLVSGTPTGLGTGAIKRWTQASDGVGGDVADVDYWGETLEIRDTGWSTTPDLAVSDGRQDGGMVTILRGTGTGLAWNGSMTLTQEVSEEEADDNFGLAL